MTRPAGVFDVRYEQDIAILRTIPQWVALGLFLLFLLLVPQLFPSRFLLNVINTILIITIAIHGLNILTGYAGQISAGHAAFMGVGAYACASFMTIWGLNFWISLPLAASTAGVVGILFGLPSLRLKGFYLAMATIAAQFIIAAFFLHFKPEIFRGAQGMSIEPIQLGSIVFDTQQNLYYLIMPIAVLMTYFAQNLVRSSLGRAFVAIRDNDLAAEIMGISLFGYKLRAFFIGCFFAGVAGALNIAFRWTVRPDQYSLMDSIWMLGIIIIGGMGSILGGVLGTVFIKVLDELVSALTPFLGRVLPSELASRIGASTGLVVFGMVVVLFLILEPRGLAHRWEILKGRFRHWPFTYGH
ncbi:MAG: branched-chain amino acid ABC transporter permease [Desulfobacteraceae bacterium]|jgi:branched-chain amino acid transport system permease protein